MTHPPCNNHNHLCYIHSLEALRLRHPTRLFWRAFHLGESLAADTTPIRLHLLGGFRLVRYGEEVPPQAWGKRTAARRLVKLLATVPDHRLHRWRAVDLLWQDLDHVAGLNSLGKALHAARRALEPGLTPRRPSAYLRLDDGILSLDSVSIDLDDFERLAEAALATQDPATLQAAHLAYSGDLLPEDRYEEWAIRRREQLRDLWLEVLAALAGVREREGNVEAAIRHLQTLLSADRTVEEAHRSLMALYARSGRRHLALRQFEELTRALRDDLACSPSRASIELCEVIRADALPVPN